MKSITRISLATTLLTTLASAQQNYAIDPNSVNNATREYWCQQQTSQCPLICLQEESTSATTESNECDYTSLTYSCVCDNGQSPNVSEYSQTLPYFICTEWGTQCVANCGGDSGCAASCQQDHPCGARNPTRVNTSTISSTMSASASGSMTADGAATTDSSGETIYQGFAAQGASATGNDNGNGGSGGDQSAATHVRVWALSAGQTFGTLGLVGAFIGGFAVLL